MKSKKTIIISILIILIIVAIIVVLIKNTETISAKNSDIKEYVNCIMHRGDYSSGYYDSIYVFLENGEYYYFYQQYDAMVRDKAYKGKWKIEDNKIKTDVEKAIYLEGGEIVDVEENDNYINKTKIINGQLKVKDFKTTFFLEYEKGKENVEKYSKYLKFKDDASYFPIYEYETVNEVKEKLNEIYGEIFTLLN